VFSPCWARNSLLGPIPCWARRRRPYCSCCLLGEGPLRLSLSLPAAGEKGGGYQHPPAVTGGHRWDDREGGGTPVRSWR
jgi:hypothetical protein